MNATSRFDLSNPVLPDVADLDRPTSSRHLPRDWQKASEGESSGHENTNGKGKGKASRLGPNQAKLIAAMSGAMTTSLLSKQFLTFFCLPLELIADNTSDAFRRAQNPPTNGTAYPASLFRPKSRRGRMLPSVYPPFNELTPIRFSLRGRVFICLCNVLLIFNSLLLRIAIFSAQHFFNAKLKCHAS
jgi:hypothetical protein